MADHMTAEQLRVLIESAQALADSLPRGDTLRYYCRKHELTRLRKALDAARLSGMAADPWIEIVRGKLESITQCHPRAVHTLAREALDAMPSASPEPPHD